MDEVEVLIQVNGKPKVRLITSPELSKEALEKLALENQEVQSAIAGKEVKKVIAVPGRLVNIVAK